MDKNNVKSEKGFRAHNSKGVDKNGAKCNMGFGRISKIYRWHDVRRLEVVAEGLPLFHGAIDTTLVSPVRRDGLPRARCEREDGAALAMARRRKERTPNWAFCRAKLVVLACKVGGRWSDETQAFLRQLAKAKARTEVVPLQSRARAACLRRWMTILACSSARAFASSLLEARGSGGCGGPTPSTAEVVGEHRHLGGLV